MLLVFPLAVAGQCLTPELAVINSCIEHPNPNGSGAGVESELLVVSSGVAPVPVSDFGVDLPFNGFGPANADIGTDVSGNPLGCAWKEPTILALPGCDNAIPLGPNDVIPPNSLVVIFTTGTTTTDDLSEVDFSNICPMGQPIYVLQNACERTAGAFANEPPAMGNPLRTITVISPCGLRGFTYNTLDLNSDEGTYYLVGLNEIGNLDCALPVIPETCPVIDTTFFVCDAAGDLPIIPATDLASIYPEDVLAVSFHPSPLEAEGNANRITAYQTTGQATDTIYSRIINSFNFCIAIGELVIVYQSGPAVTMSPQEPLRGCDPEGNEIGLFNLRLGDAEIGGGQPVTYYTDAAGTQEISSPEQFQSTAGTIFARAGLLACEGNIVPVDLILDPGPQVAEMITGTSCPTNEDGAITLDATGFGALVYSWAVDSFSPTATQTDLAAGGYDWSVTDASGCTAEGLAVINVGATVMLSCQTISGVSGPGADDGEIGLIITEGNGPFQVTYTGAVAGAMEVTGAMGVLTGLPAGNYAVQVTDADGCTSETCFSVVGLVDPILLDCSVRNDANGNIVLGSISIDIDGGEPLFSVTITGSSGGSTTQNNQDRGEVIFNNLTVGSYTITVTDAAGQVATCTQTIMQDNCPLEIVNVRLLVSDCSGSDNTIISLEIAGFQAPVGTDWSGGNNIDIFDGLNEAGPLPPGSYFASVSDASGCPPVMVGPIVVEDRGPILANLVDIVPSAPCLVNGQVAIVPTMGGTPPYTVILTESDGTEIGQQTVLAGDTARFAGLAGGDGTNNYAYFITDEFGCATTSEPFSLTTSPRPMITLDLADQTISPPTCFGGSDGAFSLSASGGNTPYTYAWLDYPERGAGRVLDSLANQDDLPAGDYVVEVIEAGGCRDTFLLNLPDGDRPTVFCGITTPVIGTTPGTVILTLGADAPPLLLTFLLPDGQQVFLPGVPTGDATIAFNEPGDFLVFGADLNGCNSDTCSFTIIEEPCALTATALTEPVDCSGGGQIVVSVSGGTEPLTFNWAEPSFPARDTVRPSAAGDYAVMITDSNGCSLDTFFSVGRLLNFPSLIGDSLEILPSCSGNSIAIPLSFTGEGPFELTFGVVNVNGPQMAGPTLSFSAVDTLWLPASWFTGLGATISASLLEDQNCSTDLFLSTDYVLTRPDTVRRSDIVCLPDGLMIGGQLFTPSMPSDTFSVDDGSECGLVFMVDLTFLQPEIPDTLEVFICPGTDFEIPETGDVFNAGRPEGEVVFTREGQCDSLVYIRLDIPEVFIGNFSTGACEGDTVFLGDRFFTVDNPAGLAILEGEASSGCDSLIAVTVNFTIVGELRLLGDHAICPGDSLELRFAYDGQGGVSARLENLQGEILDLNNVRDGDRVLLTPEQSTTWSIVSVSSGACPGTFTGRSEIVVSDFSLATVILTNPADFCQDTLGRSIALPAGGQEPYTISWSNGPQDSLNPNLLAGTYLVTVEDAQGCVLVDSVQLTDRPNLSAVLSALPPLCEGSSGRLELDTIFGGGGFYEMSLDGEFFLPVERVGDFRPPVGTGLATFQDVDDCMITVPFIVPGALRPTFNPSTDTTIFIGDSILLDPGISIAIDTAWWTPPATLGTPNALQSIARPRNTTDYSLIIISEDGCSFNYRVTVRVDERLPVYAPTAFSPNGDDVNDVYRLEFGPRVRELLTFQIFNRWGSLIHEGPNGWDGMLDGQPAQSAVYVFQAVVVLLDGTERYIKGDFVLKR